MGMPPFNGPQQAAAIRRIKGLPSSVPIIGQGPVGTQVFDRFNRPIAPMDIVHVAELDHYRPLFRVIDVVPNPDPQAPPGSALVRCVTEFNIMVIPGRPMQNLLRVLSAAEQGQGVAAGEAEGQDAGVAPPAPPDGAAQ